MDKVRHIKKLISTANTLEAAKLVSELVSDNKKLYKYSLILNANLKSLQSDRMKNTITNEWFNIRTNELTSNLLDILQEFEDRGNEQNLIRKGFGSTFFTFFTKDRFFRTALILTILLTIVFSILSILKNTNSFLIQTTIWSLVLFLTGFIYRYTYLYLSEKRNDGYDDDLKIELEKIRHQKLTFSEKDKKDLLEDIKTKIDENLLQSFEEKSLPEIKKIKRYDKIKDYLRESRSRLLDEINSLNSKANVNLSIAVVTTILAVGFLIYSSINIQKGFETWFEFISYYIPRITLVIFIELFSYYFLILYKSSLGEIKFYQNELTNIEFKTLSLRIALLSDNEENLIKLTNDLMAIERNQILKKDETTLSLEKYKTESEFNKFFIERIPTLEMFKENIKDWNKENKIKE